MVNSVTSLTGNGLKDWLIQRVTAVYMTLYSLGVFIFFIYSSPANYDTVHAFFSNTAISIATLVALLALSLHAWIGVWTVTTDYITCTVLRLSTQLFVLAWLLGQFIWGILILWGHA